MKNDPLWERVLENMREIEAQATTPLKPDTSGDLFFEWFTTNTLPKLGDIFPNESVLTILALVNDYTIGYYDYAKKQWQTDLGMFKPTEPRYWAYIPKIPA